MGRKENCMDCTYRIDGAHNITLCLIQNIALLKTHRCAVKEVGDPIVERIKKLEVINKK